MHDILPLSDRIIAATGQRCKGTRNASLGLRRCVPGAFVLKEGNLLDKRTFLRYIGQNIAGMIGLSCYILIDTLFVSIALGASGLAALNLAITVFSVVSSVGQLLGIGGGTDFALRKGEGHATTACLHTASLTGNISSARR